MINESPAFTMYPDRPRLQSKDERFSLIAEAGEGKVLPENLTLAVFSLEQVVFKRQITIPSQSSLFVIPISLQDADIRSAGLGFELTDGIYTATSSLDIGEGPVRYGFVSDFTPADAGRTDAVLKNFLKNHITHVQFYDWTYRPDKFAPDGEKSVYHDTMGKEIDLFLVKNLISTFSGHGIRSLAYGAVYAATKEYADKHVDEALYDAEGHTFDLIGKFFIMNLRNGQWRKRIISQYRYAVDPVGFDGIHMDTYGYPKIGWGYGEDVSHSLEQPFVQIINEWGKERGENIFNNVGGWPAKVTAGTNQAACYIEVWDPHVRYRHLISMVKDVVSSGKAVVLAAYLLPFKKRDEGTLDENREPLAAAQLLTAAVSACGATSLLLGQEQAVLTQPYYSDYSLLSSSESEGFRQYYDFQVRYRDLFYDTALVDITESHLFGENGEFQVSAGEYPVSWEGIAGSLWVSARKSDARLVINLINLTGQDDDLWNAGKRSFCKPVSVRLKIPRYWKDVDFFTSSPEYPSAEKLDAHRVQGVRGPAVEISLVMTGFWQTVFTV